MGEKKRSLSTRILIGLGIGVVCGLFFGEYCTWLGILGEAFVKLLQMTILPYIVVSLVLRIGGLDFEQAKRLAVRGGLLLLFFWVLGIVIPLVGSLAMPTLEQGSFFSTSSVTPEAKVNYLDEYIPWNPFYSMANTVVPAVVLFSVLVGVALIGIKEKGELLRGLKILSETLTKITDWVVSLTPYGIFAIAADAAATMTIKQFESLQVYLILYIILALLLTFLILPVLGATLTPFSYRDIVSVSKDALVTGFTTSSLFVVMPVVSSGLKRLFEKYKMENEGMDSTADIVIPIYYNLPETGKLLSLIFILFAAWYLGTPIPMVEYPYFGVTGFLSFLGNVNLAVPYLLNQFHLQSDMFGLFVASGVVNARFSTLGATMDMLVFSLLCACAMHNMLRIQWKRLLPYWAAVVLVFLGVIFATRIAFDYTVSHTSAELERLNSMDVASDLKARVLRYSSTPRSGMERQTASNRLEAIRRRGVLRVGFSPDSMPFAYTNGNGEVVGFDIAMAYQLADDMKCSLELVEVNYSEMAPAFEDDEIDIVMSGTTVMVEMIESLAFSSPVMDLHLSLVVKDYRKDAFESVKKIRKIKGLKVADVTGGAFLDAFRSIFPDAEVVSIDSHKQFFEGHVQADALLISAEAGGPWTLRYPEYQVVIPKSLDFKTMAAYPLPIGDQEYANFMNQWLELKKLNGFVKQNYDKWILGKEKKLNKPRWCVIRNVLHWVE